MKIFVEKFEIGLNVDRNSWISMIFLTFDQTPSSENPSRNLKSGRVLKAPISKTKFRPNWHQNVETFQQKSKIQTLMWSTNRISWCKRKFKILFVKLFFNRCTISIPNFFCKRSTYAGWILPIWLSCQSNKSDLAYIVFAICTSLDSFMIAIWDWMCAAKPSWVYVNPEDLEPEGLAPMTCLQLKHVKRW